MNNREKEKEKGAPAQREGAISLDRSVDKLGGQCPSAVTQLSRHHLNLLTLYAECLLGAEDTERATLAEDLVQEAVSRVLDATIQSSTPIANPVGFLRGVIYNLWRNKQRTRKRRGPNGEDGAGGGDRRAFSASRSVDHCVNRWFLDLEEDEVRRFLAGLPVRKRTVAKLLMEGMKPTEVAEHLGISPQAVRRHRKEIGVRYREAPQS